MGSTLRQRLKDINKLKRETFLTDIVYYVMTDLSDELPIEVTHSLLSAREVIRGINEYYKEHTGSGIRLFIKPVLIDDDTGGQ